MSVVKIVEDGVTPIINNLGYEVIEIEYAKKQNGMNLTVFIDGKNGITLNDCEKVHIAVDAILDELDPTNGESYTLNISSSGLDRPIKTDVQLNLNIGVELEASLYTKVNGKKNYIGVLSEFDENTITLLVNNNSVILERKNISKLIKNIEI